MKSYSDTNRKQTGVLILAYGGGTKWNKTLETAIEPFKNQFKVEIAFGMANYVTIYKGVRKLEQGGVNRILVIQLFISSHSPLIYQNEYLLGKRESLPGSPMPMMQHISEYKELMGLDVDENDKKPAADEGHHRMYMPENLKPVPHNSEIILTPALDDHPIVAQILHKRIKELSENPVNESVFLVAHGPIDEEYNRQWILTMENLAEQIHMNQLNEGQAFQNIFCLTVRDDAPKLVFEQAKSNLRAMVRQAGKTSTPIVIPLFLSPGGREKAIAQRLESLEFKWTGKTLLPDPLLLDYLTSTVEKALSE